MGIAAGGFKERRLAGYMSAAAAWPVWRRGLVGVGIVQETVVQTRPQRHRN